MNQEKASLRRASLAELSDLAPLFDLYRVFYDQESSLASAERFLRERLEADESVVFICYRQQVPIGFTQLFPSFSSVSMQRQWILNDLFVVGSARGIGAGELLLKAAEDFAHEDGAKGLILETHDSNRVAQRLYERLGWKRDESTFHYSRMF